MVRTWLVIHIQTQIIPFILGMWSTAALSFDLKPYCLPRWAIYRLMAGEWLDMGLAIVSNNSLQQ